MLILLVIIFYPVEKTYANDYITFAGYIFLTMNIYVVLLIGLIPEQETSVEDIQTVFQQQNEPTKLYQVSLKTEYNYLQLSVNKHEITISTDLTASNLAITSMFKSMLIAGLSAPLPAIAVFAIRSLYLPVEQFFIIFFTAIYYVAIIVLLVLVKLTIRLSTRNEEIRVFYCVKKATTIQISVRLSEHLVGKHIHNRDQTIEIPRDKFADELFLNSLDEIFTEIADRVGRFQRFGHSVLSHTYIFPMCICVNLDSPNVKLIQSAQLNEGLSPPVTSKFLLFGLLDRKLLDEFYRQLLQWAQESPLLVKSSSQGKST